MKAMILAAGFGLRLRPLTNDIPKPLLPINNKPLIFHTLELLKKYGITDVVINVHYHGEKIMAELGDGSRFGMRIDYSREFEILGTGGGIKKVTNLLSDGSFILINSDILIDIDLDEVVKFHNRNKGAATMVLRENKESGDFGQIGIDNQNLVREFLGKVGYKEGSLTNLMFTGLHILEPDIFEYIPDKGFYNITDSYISMIKDNKKVYGYITDGYWCDIGTIERYNEVSLNYKI